MKTRSRKNYAAKIPTSRWLAYAGAGAATALTGATSVDAEIHYSGRVDVTFRGDETKSVAFPLDQPGDSIVFSHRTNYSGGAYFGAVGLRSGAFVGTYSSGLELPIVLRLKQNDRYISEDPFLNYTGTMVGAINHIVRGEWRKGIGFVGFRFDNGAGKQYGWARVRMDGRSANFRFKVLDYAYADPGEPIKPGQRSSSSMNAPDEGSLGLLAAGAAGVALWRQRRKRGLR